MLEEAMYASAFETVSLHDRIRQRERERERERRE